MTYLTTISLLSRYNLATNSPLSYTRLATISPRSRRITEEDFATKVMAAEQRLGEPQAEGESKTSLQSNPALRQLGSVGSAQNTNSSKDECAAVLH